MTFFNDFLSSLVSLLHLKAVNSSMEVLVSPTFAASEIKLEEERSNLRLAEVSVTASSITVYSLAYIHHETVCKMSCIL